MPIFDKNELLQATQHSLGDRVGEIKTLEGIEQQKAAVEPTEPTAPQTEPTFSETLGATFGQENIVTNAVDWIFGATHDFGAPDPDFDPLSDDNIAGYEEHAAAFVGVQNRQESEFLKIKLDKEAQDRETIAKSGSVARVVSALAAGVADPLITLPAVKYGMTVAKAARTAQGVASGAAIGAVSGTLREGVLQGAQESRDTGESMYNIMAEATIGGILGGSFAALANPVKEASKQILADALKGTDNYRININADGSVAGVERSVGAAQTSFNAELEKEALAHINKNVVKTISGLGLEGLQSPVIRGLTADSGVIRQLTSFLYDHNMTLLKEVPDEAGQTIGRQQSAQLLMERDKAALIRNESAVKNMYLKHTGVGAVRSALRRPEGKLSWNDFNTRVSKILRDDTITDTVPEVNEAAKIYRASLDNWAKKLQEVGALPAELELKTARNYLTRVYNVEELAKPAVRKQFINTLADRFHRFDIDGVARTYANKGESDEALAEAKAAADDVYRKITRQGDDAAMFNNMSEDLISGARSMNKERTLNVPDSILEPFLVNDASQLTAQYANRASNIVRVQEAIRALPQGFESFNDLKIHVNDEYSAKIAAATDDATAAKLIKEQAGASDLLDQMYRSMTGSLFKSSKATKYFERLRQYQYMRLLGGVTLSSLPELAMPALRMGLLNTLRDGYLPMLRSWKTAKLTRDQFKDLDIGLEREMNNVLEALSDNSASLGRAQTGYDRAMSVASDAFGKASGLTYFTSFGRRLAAQVSSSELIRLMQRRATLTATEKQRLATAGIGTNDYERVAAMIDKYADDVNGSWIPNYDQWDDEGAKTLFKDYVQRQVNATVLKPGRGDIPFAFQKSDLGRLIFQFKSFSSAASGRITIAGLQSRDARTLMGLTYLAALGTLSVIVKDKVAGRETTDDPAELLLKGISSAGFPGLIGSTLLNTGLNAYNPETRRYAAKNLAGNLVGPSVSQIQDISELLINRMGDGDLSDSDIRAGLRMVPFNNLFYLQQLTNQAFGDKK